MPILSKGNQAYLQPMQLQVPEVKREFRAKLRLKAYKLPKYPRPALDGI